MSKKLIFPAMLVAVFALSLAVVSCAGETSKLVGVWENEKEGNLEMLKDGTGVFGGDNVTWKAENGVLTISQGSVSFSFDYAISGKDLSLTYSGEAKVWTKK